MKRNRIILLILWILSLVGISLRGGPVTYGFFAVITLVPVILLLYLLIVFWKVRIYQEMGSRSQVSDKNTDFYFTLQNESLIAFSGVRVTFFKEFSTIIGLDDGTEYELMPATGIELKTGIVCKYRGSYEVGVRRIIIRDFLKIFEISFKNQSPLNAIVFPKIVHLDNLKSSNLSSVCARESKTNKTEADVLTREYVQGDDVRFIQWQASAKSGKLMVRERTGEEDPGVGIIMDSCRYSEEPEKYLPVENKILELDLALTCYLLTRNIPVNSVYMKAGRSEERQLGKLNAFDLYYSEMCRFEFLPANDNRVMAENLKTMKKLQENHMIFLIIHKWVPELLQFAVMCADNSIPVTVYLVNDDAGELPEAVEAIRNIEFIRVGTDADLMGVLQ